MRAGLQIFSRITSVSARRSAFRVCLALTSAEAAILTFTALASAAPSIPATASTESATSMVSGQQAVVGIETAIAPNAASGSTPPLSPAIKWVDPKPWQIRVEGRIKAYQDIHHIAETYSEFDLKNTPLIFPVVMGGGFSTNDLSQMKNSLWLDGHLTDSKFEVLPTQDPSFRLARYLISEFKGQEVRFSLEEVETCYSAKVDEKALQAMPWLENDALLPADAKAALKPQLYIESTDALVTKLLDKWTNGKPKSITPYLLGKELARRVGDAFQPSGTNWTKDGTGQYAGIEVNGALSAINVGRGPANDAICLYIALCRAAGLPARPVIGIDMKKPQHGLATWAEFYVPNAGWISLDMRKYYDGPGTWRDVYAVWPGVGTNEDLHDMVPISYHFHPPLAVRAEGMRGKPLLWGWQPVPEAIVAEQALRFVVMAAPIRGPLPPPPTSPPGDTSGRGTERGPGR